jgi:hypothetical protein
MKKVFFTIICTVIFCACADKKAQEQAALDSVTNIHDKIMGEDEQLMKNKLLLDSLVSKNTPAKDSATVWVSRVVLADSAMSTWMHNFDVDMKGKSHEQKMDYLGKQKQLVKRLDTQMNVALTGSHNFLIKNNIK